MLTQSEQILVVFLSAALALFLVLAIVIAIQIIRLLRILQTIAGKAERFVESAEAMSEMVRNTVGGLSIVKFISNVVDIVKRKKNKEDADEG